jgi:Holliday junction DNA helicase RuvB
MNPGVDDIRRQADADELVVEGALRPGRLDEYVGQTAVKENLRVFLQAARGRGEPVDHMLFYGPPGLGKTTLAAIIAREMDANLRTTSGPAIERQGDLAAMLTNLQPGDVLFIDEIHRLPKPVEEMLYPAMEDYRFDIIIGKGPGAQSVQMTLPRFTLVGATTRLGLLSAPLRARFGWQFQLEFYDDDELFRIIVRAAALQKLALEPAGGREIARRSRGTPRIALRLLNRIRDFAEVAGTAIDEARAAEGLSRLGIDVEGLDPMDQKLLLTIIDKYGGGPVGLDTLAASIGEEKDTIEGAVEPYLLQKGFIARTPRGRTATALAFHHFGRKSPVPQGGLFE